MPDNEQAPKERIRSLDFYKGFAILAVMAVHVFVFQNMDTGNGDGQSGGMPLIVQCMYLGLMGFFVISGYFYRPNRGFVNNVKKRLLIGGVAYLSCALILPLILCAEMAVAGPNAPSVQDYVDALPWVWGCPTLFEEYDAPAYYAMCAAGIGYYYIQVMLVSFLVFYAIVDHLLNDWRKMAATIVALIAIETLLVQFYPNNLPMHCHLAPIATSFMLLSAAAGKHRLVERLEFGAWKEPRTLVIMGMCLIICVVVTILSPPGTGFNDANFGANGGWSVPPFFINAASVMVLEIFACVLLVKIPYFSRFLSYMGRHTLSLMLMQGFVIKLILIPSYEISTSTWFPATDMAIKIVLYICSMVIPIVISNLVIRHLAPFFFKLLGRDAASPI